MIAERVKGGAISSAPAPDVLAMDVPVGYDAVRLALQDWRRWIEGVNACPDLANRAEIVLAEVLNNITEHAYAGQKGALPPITLRCRISGEGLHVVVVDQGRPVPADQCLARGLPSVPPAAQDMDSLPEGGFGWCLIRDLTRDLRLVSRKAGNRLFFVVPLFDLENRGDPATRAPQAKPV